MTNTVATVSNLVGVEVQSSTMSECFGTTATGSEFSFDGEVSPIELLDWWYLTVNSLLAPVVDMKISEHVEATVIVNKSGSVLRNTASKGKKPNNPSKSGHVHFAFMMCDTESDNDTEHDGEYDENGDYYQTYDSVTSRSSIQSDDSSDDHYEFDINSNYSDCGPLPNIMFNDNDNSSVNHTADEIDGYLINVNLNHSSRETDLLWTDEDDSSSEDGDQNLFDSDEIGLSKFLVDSGSTSNFCPLLELFDSIDRSYHGKVTFGNGQSAFIEGKGTLKNGLTDVLFVPKNLKIGLVSVSAIDRAGGYTIFANGMGKLL